MYDSLDRTDEIKQGAAGNTVLTYKFIYNGEGDLYELRNYKTHRSTFFEYDHAGRCMASTEKSFTGTGAAVTYTGILSGYRYEYDANNNLSKLICRMGNEEEPSWATTYVYDKDNRPTEVLLDNGKKIINTYDAIGRVTSRDLKNENTTILGTTITYVPGANGSKTALVATYQNGTDDAYNYAYDENGNIIQIWRGSGTFDSAPEKYSYEYDAANQLVRENLYYGSGNSNNATYVYTYDQWGNILTKKRHLYTTGTPGGNGLLLGNYSYTDSQWGDLLTSYNGSTITYDAMGNPTSYLGKTLTWEGKQLTGYSHGSTGISYAYNEDGLRLQKIVNNETTEYCYNGSVLIGMKVGTGNTAKILRFSYDASGNAAAVDYSADNGSTFTTYYYVRNAQNDVVKLIDGSGNTVVEYLYDSWGKSISVTGTLATTLGADQPFRYRGYVYDTETQWYYLQSRYYDPATCRFISADVLLSTGQGVIGHNSFAYCLNNPAMMQDPSGNWSWSGFLAGVAIAAVGVACAALTVASAGSLTPLAVGIAYTASVAIATTGVATSYAAATDSTMVVDFSVSANYSNTVYEKVGTSLVVDFATDTIELYPHHGTGVGNMSGISYSVGIVENYHESGDYAGNFNDFNLGTKYIGINHCYAPGGDYRSAVKATSISFSFMPSGNYCGFTTDRYLKPIVIHKGKKKAVRKRTFRKPSPKKYYCLAY